MADPTTITDTMEDVESFRLRAQAWVPANLPALDGADPWKGRGRD